MLTICCNRGFQITFFALLAGLLGGCSTEVTIDLSGTAGAQVSGFYIAKDHRTDFQEPLPWRISIDGLTKMEIHKESPDDLLIVKADSPGRGHSSTMNLAGNKFPSGVINNAKAFGTWTMTTENQRRLVIDGKEVEFSESDPELKVELTGTPGAEIVGYYIKDGKRMQLSGTLPMTLVEPGITLLAVRKVKKEDKLQVSALRKSPVGSMTFGSPAGNADGIGMTLADSFSVRVIGPDESLDAPENSIQVISPYWHDGTWVFDDARFGLVREAFVAGVPDMVNYLVKDVPNARAGFRLTFSAKPFPTYQKKLTWVRTESGGNFYRIEDPPMEGWLCPTMFRYFSETPKELYVRADGK